MGYPVVSKKLVGYTSPVEDNKGLATLDLRIPSRSPWQEGGLTGFPMSIACSLLL
jgi:hypothetical protein